jgi:hypothetical protein
LIVVAVQQLRHITEGSPSHPDVDHGSDQHPYHALKEAVGLDGKAQTLLAGALRPVR